MEAKVGRTEVDDIKIKPIDPTSHIGKMTYGKISRFKTFRIWYFPRIVDQIRLGYFQFFQIKVAFFLDGISVSHS